MRRKTGRFLAGCMAAFVAMTSSYVPVAAEETDSVIAPKEGAYGYYVENSEKNKNIKDGTSPDLDPSVRYIGRKTVKQMSEAFSVLFLNQRMYPCRDQRFRKDRFHPEYF